MSDTIQSAEALAAAMRIVVQNAHDIAPAAANDIRNEIAAALATARREGIEEAVLVLRRRYAVARGNTYNTSITSVERAHWDERAVELARSLDELRSLLTPATGAQAGGEAAPTVDIAEAQRLARVLQEMPPEHPWSEDESDALAALCDVLRLDDEDSPTAGDGKGGEG